MIKPYKFLFHLRFDLVEYRIRATWIAENLNIASCLLRMPDLSFEIQRHALALTTFARKESRDCIEHYKISTTQLTKHCPRIKEELLLQDCQFHLLLDLASKLLQINKSTAYTADGFISIRRPSRLQSAVAKALEPLAALLSSNSGQSGVIIDTVPLVVSEDAEEAFRATSRHLFEDDVLMTMKSK